MKMEGEDKKQPWLGNAFLVFTYSLGQANYCNKWKQNLLWLCWA